jgi:hypothetical protein
VSRLRLYFDEDSLRHALVNALRAQGADVLTANEAGMIQKPDEDHLRYATSLGRSLFSYNVSDFYRLHSEFLSTSEEHAGLILSQQQRYNLGEQMRRILRIIAARSAEDMRNRLEFLSGWP